MSGVIEVRGLSKKYKLFGRNSDRIKEALSFGRRQYHTPKWALKDIHLDVQRGSALGIIGANGSGKSTFMKILTGTTEPSSGSYTIHGHVGSLLELGAGFHPDFTGIENIFMNATILGFKRREIKELLPRIIDFAELGDYIDQPVRTYSSGMVMRLGFSVAMAIEPEVLIVDEVFAVGDMHFQKKCVDKIFEFKKQNKTILFCSHSMFDVRQICDRVMWLKHGHLEAIGDPLDVTADYANYIRSMSQSDKHLLGEEIQDIAIDDRPVLQKIEVRRPGQTEDVRTIQHGEDIEFWLHFKNPHPGRYHVNAVVAIMRNDNIITFGTTSEYADLTLDQEAGIAVLSLPNFQQLNGEFVVTGHLFDENHVHRYSQIARDDTLIITADRHEVGVFMQPCTWKILPPEHGSAQEEASSAGRTLES
ncbi:MAG: ABC transporter ATP-binding protein [Planctomycetota bacterium]